MLLGNRRVCAPNKAQGGGGIGDPCNTGDDCRGGFCASNRMCVGGCAVTSDKGQYCPGRWGCNPIDTLQGFYTLGCLPAGLGALGTGCNDNADCAGGLCVTDNQNRSYCSRFCNSAPCPATIPNCKPAGITADGVVLMTCEK